MQALKQADNEAVREALKKTESKLDSFHEQNNNELQSIRELIDVSHHHLAVLYSLYSCVGLC